jgi:YHS domain-containing protein
VHRDPICGRSLSLSQIAASFQFDDHRYHFCSARCRYLFRRQAERVQLFEQARTGSLLTSGRVRWGQA